MVKLLEKHRVFIKESLHDREGRNVKLWLHFIKKKRGGKKACDSVLITQFSSGHSQ